MRKKRIRLSEPVKPKGIIRGEKCKFCKHVYLRPCHGKDLICQNALWLKYNKKVDVSHLTWKQLSEIKKTGKLPKPSEIKKPKEPEPKRRKRVRLKKRVRL